MTPNNEPDNTESPPTTVFDMIQQVNADVAAGKITQRKGDRLHREILRVAGPIPAICLAPSKVKFVAVREPKGSDYHEREVYSVTFQIQIEGAVVGVGENTPRQALQRAKKNVEAVLRSGLGVTKKLRRTGAKKGEAGVKWAT